MSKSSVVNTDDALAKRQQQNITQSATTTVIVNIPLLNIQTTPKTTNQAPTVTTIENINQVKTNKENAQVEEDDPLKEEVYVNQPDGFIDPHHLNPRRLYMDPSKIQGHGTMNSLTSWNLDLPVPSGIFINQAKYAQEILKKHGMTSCDSIGTPIATRSLYVDLSGTPVDQTKYHSIKFPLPEEFPTASEDGSHCKKKRDATARKIALLSISRRNCQSKMAVTLS
nr:hypothetical protein [Tanacetum cinerariifolium]